MRSSEFITRVCEDVLHIMARRYRSKERKMNLSPLPLIVSIEGDTVETIDEMIGKPFGGGHPAKGNGSEFVRLAIEEKLERDMVQFQSRA